MSSALRVKVSNRSIENQNIPISQRDLLSFADKFKIHGYSTLEVTKEMPVSLHLKL